MLKETQMRHLLLFRSRLVWSRHLNVPTGCDRSRPWRERKRSSSWLDRCPWARTSDDNCRSKCHDLKRQNVFWLKERFKKERKNKQLLAKELTTLAQLHRLCVDVFVVEEARERALCLQHKHLSMCEYLFGHFFGLRDDKHKRTLLAQLLALLSNEDERWA